ncbi:hypothetical protein niasHT_021325 [Heterodera trifolii]|uniref:Uncharacterized protein n=1 Tax=Heterodera trifolii TaxID=157864 RepID=A0ABD2K6F3_9BILA
MDRWRRLPGGPAILAAVGCTISIHLPSAEKKRRQFYCHPFFFSTGKQKRKSKNGNKNRRINRQNEQNELLEGRLKWSFGSQHINYCILSLNQRRSELGRVSSIKTTFRHGLWKKVDRVGHPNGPELDDALLPAEAPHATADGSISSSTTAGGRRGWRKGQRTTKTEEGGEGHGEWSLIFSPLDPTDKASFTHRMRVNRPATVKWVKCNAFVGLLTIFFPADGRRDPLKAFIARVGVELFLFASDLRETDGPQQKEWQKMI